MTDITMKAAAGIGLFAYLDAKYQIGHDLNMAGALVTTTMGMRMDNLRDTNSLWWAFHKAARKYPQKDCYVCEGKIYSYRDVELLSRRVARYLLSKACQRKDVVALYMANKPAYPILWIACMSIDVIPAFINYNLTGQGFAHCVKAAKCKFLLFDSDLEANVAEIASDLINAGTSLLRWHDLFCLNGPEKASLNCATCDEAGLAKLNADPVSRDYVKGIGWQDVVCLVYTSGTTGLPKPATCTHGRVSAATYVLAHINRFTAKDRTYSPMPLYHSTASFLGVGVSWRAGSTFIIGRKFSATKYWDEVKVSNATVMQYVGEVCRYLLAVPPTPHDKHHNVRMAYGNGMRPDVWERFRERFGVPVISEIFASTEGNGSLFNYNTGPFGAGAVGREGALVEFVQRKNQPIVKVDQITEEPMRDAKGFCIRADVNEHGELLSVIERGSAYRDFKGYYGNEEATKKKILRNVFKKGDIFFRTGDLVRKDADGLIYFGDRLGDNFRWRSENISTADVAAAMGEVVDEANVYGVLVPNGDGRACCAAIPVTAKVDFDALAAHVIKQLPGYARPLFLRIVPAIESTGTAKQLKVQLRLQGVDPATVADSLYWLKGNRYVPFRREDWDAILAGKVKL